MLPAARRVGVTLGRQGVRRIIGQFVEAVPRIGQSEAAAEFAEGMGQEMYTRGVQEGARAIQNAGGPPTSMAGTVRGMLASLGFSSEGVARMLRGEAPTSATDAAILCAKLAALGIAGYATITALRRYMNGDEEESKEESGEGKSASLEDID